jgi:CheY-like chemotaxis protein
MDIGAPAKVTNTAPTTNQFSMAEFWGGITRDIFDRMSERQTILIVEDDEDLRRLFRTALTLDGYDVIEAGDGLEALQRIDLMVPDLVILDLLLPGLSGTAVKQELAAQALTREIPIVVITGSYVDANDLDVACLLRKPVTPDQLIRTVRTCLAASQGGAV